MDSTHSPSPHCIPSPPIFSLDIRNLGHLCFDELPAAATTDTRSQHQNFAISQNNAQQKKIELEKAGDEPTTFLPIEQHTAESKCMLDENQNGGSIPCESNSHSSAPVVTGSEEDIFDDIFTTFEDILEDDEAGKDTSSLLYGGGPEAHYSSLLDTSSHPTSLSLSLGSSSGHTTVENSRSTSPVQPYDSHAIRNPQAYEYESSGTSSGSSNGSISEPGSETLEGCMEALQEHHNSGGMEGFIDKFGRLKKPEQQKSSNEVAAASHRVRASGGQYSSASASASSPSGWVGDSREQLLARAMAMAQQSSYQTQQLQLQQQQQQQEQQQLSQSLPESIKSSELSGGGGGGGDDGGEGLTAMSVKSVKQPHSSSPLMGAVVPVNAPPPIPYTANQCHNQHSHPDPTLLLSSTQSTTSTLATNELPIAARALPILPTSLESFRSQLSKSKKESILLAKKKNLLPPNKKVTPKHAIGFDYETVNSSLGGIAVNDKRTGDGNKKPGVGTNAKKSAKVESTSSNHSSSNNYDLSEYFSKEEISGLLSVICSDDENEGEDGGNAATTGSTQVGGSRARSRSRSHSNDLLPEHVVFAPHVDSNGAVFSFGSSSCNSVNNSHQGEQ